MGWEALAKLIARLLATAIGFKSRHPSKTTKGRHTISKGVAYWEGLYVLQRVCSPLWNQMGGNTRLRVGGANSNDWRESLALCLLCGYSGIYSEHSTQHSLYIRSCSSVSMSTLGSRTIRVEERECLGKNTTLFDIVHVIHS